VERATGRAIGDDDVLVVAMSDYLAARTDSIAPAAAGPHGEEPRVQMMDIVTEWLRRRGGRLRAAQFADPSQPRWTRTAEAAAGCPAG
jgi:hypothetical protein